MVYKVILSPHAQLEIEEALDYYFIKSPTAAFGFLVSLENLYTLLSSSPFFEIRYKNIRSAKLKKYPNSLFFIVNDEKKMVKVFSCFHNKKNPAKRPKG